MEILLGIIGLGLMLFFGFALAVSAAINKARKNAEGRAEEILDAAFDGRQQVVFQQSQMSLSIDTVLDGAQRRGYECISTDSDPYGNTKMMFTRKTD